MASAPAATAVLVSVTACRADGAPVPAITGTLSGSAARTASISITRSASVSVAASAVVPHTSTPATPRLARSAACLPVATASTSPSAPNSVTRATPTPPNTTAIICLTKGASVPLSGTWSFRLRG
jgi:hypothetical protein